MKRTTPVTDVCACKQGRNRNTRDSANTQTLLHLLLNRRVGRSICSWLPKLHVYTKLRLVSSSWRNAIAEIPLEVPAKVHIYINHNADRDRDRAGGSSPTSLHVGVEVDARGQFAQRDQAATQRMSVAQNSSFNDPSATNGNQSTRSPVRRNVRAVRGLDSPQEQRETSFETKQERVRTTMRLHIPLQQHREHDSSATPSARTCGCGDRSMMSAAAQYVAALNSLLQSAARWQMSREVCACIAVQVEAVVVTEQEHEHFGSILRPCRSGSHNGRVRAGGTTSNADTDAQILRAVLQELLAALRPKRVRVSHSHVHRCDWLPPGMTTLEIANCCLGMGSRRPSALQAIVPAMGTSHCALVDGSKLDIPARPKFDDTVQPMATLLNQPFLQFPTELTELCLTRNAGMRNDVLLCAISSLRSLKLLSLQLVPHWAMNADDVVDFRWLLPLQALESFMLWNSDAVTCVLPRVLACIPSLRNVQVDWLQLRDTTHDDIASLLVALPKLESLGTLRYATQQFWHRLPFYKRRISPWDASLAPGHDQLGGLRELILFDSDCDPADLRALVDGVCQRLPNLQILTLTIDNCSNGGTNSLGGGGDALDFEYGLNNEGAELVTANFLLNCLGGLRRWGERARCKQWDKKVVGTRGDGHGKEVHCRQRTLRFCANSEFCMHMPDTEDGTYGGITPCTSGSSVFAVSAYSHRPGTLAHTEFFESLEHALGCVRLEPFHQ